jgi:hypothetical protein
MQLKFTKTRDLFIPKQKNKAGDWVCIESKKLPKKLLQIAEALAKIENVGFLFSDQDAIYFVDETSVNAFLAAYNTYYKKEDVEFDVFLDTTDEK